MSPTVTDSVAADLRELGYAVIPLLSADEVARLRADFDTSHPDPGAGFETDFERDDAGFKQGVAERTAWVWERLADILPGYAAFMASYLVKWPTPDSDLPLHADWSYVDESVRPSYAVWVPLVDTGPGIDNGPLEVVPRSHRLVRSWRGTATPAWYEAGQAGFLAAAVPVEAPAGCAVVFDNRLLHHSPPNHGATPRPVLAGAFAPDGAPFVHVVGDGGQRGRVLEVDASFFRDHNPSGLRQARPAVPDDAPEVDLVEGAYDPVALAADHGVEDAAAFESGTGAARMRWPSLAGPASLEHAREVLEASLDLGALPWAPATVDADAGAAIHAPLVVGSRATPLGTALLGALVAAPCPWTSLRLVLVRAGVELPLEISSPAGPAEVAVIGLADGDPSLLLVGQGWASLEAGGSAAVPESGVAVRNRADGDVALLVAVPAPDGARAGGGQRWRTRLAGLVPRARRAPDDWQLAVELTEAMS